MVEGHLRLQSAIQHLNNTGVDPHGQSFKYNIGQNKNDTSATFLGHFIGWFLSMLVFDIIGRRFVHKLYSIIQINVTITYSL